MFDAIPDVLVVSEQRAMIRFHLGPSHNGRAFQELMAFHAFDRYLCHDTERTESNLLAIESARHEYCTRHLSGPSVTEHRHHPHVYITGL